MRGDSIPTTLDLDNNPSTERHYPVTSIEQIPGRVDAGWPRDPKLTFIQGGPKQYNKTNTTLQTHSVKADPDVGIHKIEEVGA